MRGKNTKREGVDRMKKGLIFTTDAILGIGIIILMISTISILSTKGEQQGPEKILSFTKATDDAIIEYYSAGTTKDTANSNNIYCKEFKKFDDTESDKVNERVRKCA